VGISSDTNPTQPPGTFNLDNMGQMLYVLVQSQQQQMQQMLQSQQQQQTEQRAQQQQMQQMLQTQQQAQQQAQQQIVQLVKEIKDERSKDQQLLLTAIATFNSGTNGTAQTSCTPTVPKPPIQIKLPKTQLPTFDGAILKWPNFWESFKINVDSQPTLDDKQKLDYLHQVVKGTAYDKIKGLGLEGDKYQEAIAILKDCYGDDIHQENAHWDALHSLPTVRENLSNLEKFVDEARALTSALKRQSVSDEVLNAFVRELTEKLPRSLMSKINEIRLIQDKDKLKLTMQELLDLLRKCQMLNIQPSEGTRKKSKEESNQQTNSSPNLPTANFNQHAQKPKPRCVFCGIENHWSDECRKVPDVNKRRELAATEKRCFKCLNKGHRHKECKRKKACFYCKSEGHNSALCLKRGTQKTDQHLNLQEEKEQSTDQAEAIQQDGYLTATKLKDGIVMATFPCKVTNPVTNQSTTLFVFLDSGARLSCINRDAAKKLNLALKKQVTLETSRFNTNKVEKIQTNLVDLDIEGPQGFKLRINAYAVPNMAPPMKTEPIQFTKSAWNKIQKLNPINKPPNSGTLAPIDILIGMDYWYSIMGNNVPTTVIQDNLVVHHTPLGNVLCGNSGATTRPSPKRCHWFARPTLADIPMIKSACGRILLWECTIGGAWTDLKNLFNGSGI
jgi:hypothetical protein